MDYKASLKDWMSQHGLGVLDVRDILKIIREENMANNIVHRSDSEQSDPLIIGSEDNNPQIEPDESMDGDFDSAMASAGHGTDEDYGYFGDSEICGE
jgi:hypothetical protein